MPMPPYGGRDSSPFDRLRIAGVADVLGDLGGRLVVVVEDVGPVDQERAVVASEGRPCRALVGHAEVGGSCLGARELLDDLGRFCALLAVDGQVEVDALVGVLHQLPARALDEGVDPDAVALVLVGLHPDLAAVLRGGVDDLVPGDRLRHVEVGLVDEGLAVPEHLGVGPEREDHELVLPSGRVHRALEGALLLELGLRLLRDFGEEAGVGELGGERRVERHQVDLGVLGREATRQLDALLARALRKDLGVDGVLVGRALLRDRVLAARVGVDVPGQLGLAVRVAAAGGEETARQRQRGERRRTSSGSWSASLSGERSSCHARASSVVTLVTGLSAATTVWQQRLTLRNLRRERPV